MRSEELQSIIATPCFGYLNVLLMGHGKEDSAERDALPTLVS